MEALECIKTRRSVRKYTEDIISNETMAELVATASHAPSWKNSQTVRYILINDKATIEKIATEGTAGFGKNEKTIGRANQLVLVTQVNGICGYEPDGSFSTNKGAGWEMFDAGIATQTFCLAAHEAGIGTVIIGIFDDAKVAEIVGLPEGQTVAAIVGFGKPVFNPDMPPRKSPEELLTII